MAVRAAFRGRPAVTDFLELGVIARRRVKLVRQTEVTECGLACLAMVGNAYGMDVDIGTLRRRFQPSMRGASLKTLIQVADGMGFNSRAVKLPLDALQNLSTPAILHWDLNHFVVLERMRRGQALIHDPLGRSKWISQPELSRHFTGIALEIRPAQTFKPENRRERLHLRQLWSGLTGFKRALAQTLVLSAIMQIFVLASPYYLQVAVDSALPAFDSNLLTVLAVGFGLLTLINVGATLLRSFVLLSAGSSISFGISVNIARRLFRLPVSWFERRHVGDVLSRFSSILPIKEAITKGAVEALIDGALAVFTLAVMAFYSVKLALVALGAFALYAAVRAIAFTAQRDAQDASIVATAKEQSTMIETVRGIVTLRLFGRETARHAFWQSRLTESMNASIRLSRLNIWQSVANTLIFGVEAVLTVWLAIGLVISGGFSLGMVFAYLAYKTQFLTRSASLIDKGIDFRMLGLHLARLADIAMADEDVSFQAVPATARQLKGRLELRDIRFRYSPSDPFILDGANLAVGPGDHVAITGPSGGGKTTLMKIMLGLLEPEEGEVLVDGIPLRQFGYKNFRSQAGAVLQDDSLFAGSLADNIALFDDQPDLNRILEAAHLAGIGEDIQRMPMGLETLVGDMGSTLSGGQKQRLLLARALYRKPRLLIIDEGTSHLDARLERQVNAAISALDITRVVIAHRAETISAAERIYGVDGGKLVAMDQDT
jgi:ATP-binding cassette, subfamily B, bacterial CvaB/MchF/RaxB